VVTSFVDDSSEYRNRFQQDLRHFNREKIDRVPTAILDQNTDFINCWSFYRVGFNSFATVTCAHTFNVKCNIYNYGMWRILLDID